MSFIWHESFDWIKVLSVGLERRCTPSVVFQAKGFMLSSIHCVMRPIHSAFCLLIVKMYAAMFEGSLIDVSLVKAAAPGFFCTVLDPELLFLFAFKRSHKLFMFSPKCDYFSWAAGFIWHRNFYVLEARERGCECITQYGLFFSQNPIRKVTCKEF